MLQLTPLGPGVLGPELPRLRMSFQADPHCRDSLAAWLEAQHAQVPSDQLVVVHQWCPRFKRELRLNFQDLNQVAKARAAATQGVTARGAAAAELAAARQQVEDSSDAALPAAIARLVAARTAFAAIQQAEELLAQQRRRQQWVHAGERPNPVMTSMLHPRKGAGQLHCWPACTWFWTSGGGWSQSRQHSRSAVC